MILRKIKLRKILIVLFLTILVWVWSDLTQDETPPARPARVVVDQSANPRLWVRFGDAAASDVEVTLSGPHSAFTELDQQLQKNQDTELLQFLFNASLEQMSEPGTHTLVLMNLLQKSELIRRLGLKVKDCEPETLEVRVVRLVEKELTLECFNERNLPITVESIKPSEVTMFVPESYRSARVDLTPQDIERARMEPVEKRPYVVLGNNQTRQANNTVQVKLPVEEDPLGEETITGARLGLVMSISMQSKYEVVLSDQTLRAINPLKIRATTTAKQAYESMLYQLLLEIDDSHIKPGTHRREVIYNFPREAYRNGLIKPARLTPIMAEFELVEIPSEES